MLSLNNSTDIIANSISLLQNGNLVDILTLINQSNSGYTQLESDNLFHTKTYLNNELNLKVNSSTLSNYMLSSDINTALNLKANLSTLQNDYTDTTNLNTALNLKVDNSTLSNYSTTTQINNLFSNYYTSTIPDGRYYTQNYIQSNYDTSTTVDTEISNNSISLTDILVGSGANSYQIYDNTNNLIRRILPTYPIRMDIYQSSGNPQHDNITIGMFKDPFTQTYEIPSLNQDQYVRLGTLYSSTSNDGRVCKFSVCCNSNVGYEHQAVDVIFTSHNTGTTGSNGSAFLGRATGNW